jgi:hypothetical protein
MSARTHHRTKVDYEERIDVHIKSGNPRRTWRLTISTLFPPRFSVVGDPSIERNWPTAAQQREIHLLLGRAMLRHIARASDPSTPNSLDIGTDTGPSAAFVQMALSQLAGALSLPLPDRNKPVYAQAVSLLEQVERLTNPPAPLLRLQLLPLLALPR